MDESESCGPVHAGPIYFEVCSEGARDNKELSRINSLMAGGLDAGFCQDWQAIGVHHKSNIFSYYQCTVREEVGVG